MEPETKKILKTERAYWVVIVIIAILTVLLIVTAIWDYPKDLPDSYSDIKRPLTSEERLLKLEELRASSTATPLSSDERKAKLNELRGSSQI